MESLPLVSEGGIESGSPEKSALQCHSKISSVEIVLPTHLPTWCLSKGGVQLVATVFVPRVIRQCAEVCQPNILCIGPQNFTLPLSLFDKVHE